MTDPRTREELDAMPTIDVRGVDTLYVEPRDLLTEGEQALINALGRVWDDLCEVVGDGPTRDADLAEAIVHVHALQRFVGSQAAARAYPDQSACWAGESAGDRPLPAGHLQERDGLQAASPDVPAPVLLALPVRPGQRADDLHPGRGAGRLPADDLAVLADAQRDLQARMESAGRVPAPGAEVQWQWSPDGLTLSLTVDTVPAP